MQHGPARVRDRSMQTHHQIQRWKIGPGQAKALADDALDEVPALRMLGQTLRHHHAQTRWRNFPRSIVKREITPLDRSPKSKNG